MTPDGQETGEGRTKARDASRRHGGEAHRYPTPAETVEQLREREAHAHTCGVCGQVSECFCLEPNKELGSWVCVLCLPDPDQEREEEDV